MSGALLFMAGRIRLEVASEAAAKMRALAAASFPLETGGVLIGHYADTWTAVVTDVAGPCADAVQGPTTFERGTAGLAELLASLWPERYYLGEWHTHPASSQEPSATDLATLRETAEDQNGKCPQALLVILGGVAGAAERWSATLWRRGEGPEQLQQYVVGVDLARGTVAPIEAGRSL